MQDWFYYCFGYTNPQVRLAKAQTRLRIVGQSIQQRVDFQCLLLRVKKSQILEIAPHDRYKAKSLLLELKQQEKIYARCQQYLSGVTLMLAEIELAVLNNTVYTTLASMNKVMKTMQARPELVEDIINETRDIIDVNKEIQTTLSHLDAAESNEWDPSWEKELADLCVESDPPESTVDVSAMAEEWTSKPRVNPFTTTTPRVATSV